MSKNTRRMKKLMGGDEGDINSPSPNDSSSFGHEETGICHQVLFSVELLSEIFSYMKPRDLIKLRSVQSAWNNEALRLLGLKSDSVLELEVNAYNNNSQFKELELHEFISKIPEGQRETSLLRYVTFRWSPYQIDGRYRDQLPPLNDFGCVIQHLDIHVDMVSDVLILFRWCPNLKTLNLKMWIGKHMKSSKKIAVDQTVYRKGNSPMTKVMEHLHTLDMSYTVQWGFGKFLTEMTPNLTTLKCYDNTFSPDDNYFRPLVGPPPDPYHFTKELKKMNLRHLKVIHYKEVNRSGIIKEFAKLDLPSLTKFCIPSVVQETEICAVEWIELLKKHASILETVTQATHDASSIYGFQDEDEFPNLPRVTNASIPHGMVISPDVFKKMPSLRKLHLLYNHKPSVMTDEDKQYCLQNGLRRSETGGFLEGNEEMWREYGDWLPHLNLDVLKVELGELTFIPQTLPQLFPSIRILELGDFTFKAPSPSLAQLGTAIRVMKESQTLVELSLRTFILPDGTGLKMVYFLLGIPVKNCDQLPKTIQQAESWTSAQFQPFITDCPLSDMKGLRSLKLSYRLRRYGCQYKSRIEEKGKKIADLLGLHCFSQMPGLQEKELVVDFTSSER